MDKIEGSIVRDFNEFNLKKDIFFNKIYSKLTKQKFFLTKLNSVFFFVFIPVALPRRAIFINHFASAISFAIVQLTFRSDVKKTINLRK
jgi:hypothetical protein